MNVDIKAAGRHSEPGPHVWPFRARKLSVAYMRSGMTSTQTNTHSHTHTLTSSLFVVFKLLKRQTDGDRKHRGRDRGRQKETE